MLPWIIVTANILKKCLLCRKDIASEWYQIEKPEQSQIENDFEFMRDYCVKSLDKNKQNEFEICRCWCSNCYELKRDNKNNKNNNNNKNNYTCYDK
jgi:hypothetical protein